jgi:hypothetical protein
MLADLRKSIFRIDVLIFLILLGFQLMFWFKSEHIKPRMEIVPPPISQTALQALSIGDEELLFRILATRLQNFGDGFGTVTPLIHYDYKRLGGWWDLLDTLNDRSHWVPSVAGYYFGAVKDKEKVKLVVEYLLKSARKNPEEKWWWLSQACYLANHKLEDKELALQIAYELAAVKNPEMPIWTRQLPAFILEDMGEKEMSLRIIKEILDNAKKDPRKINRGELNFMRYFIEERLEMGDSKP